MCFSKIETLLFCLFFCLFFAFFGGRRNLGTVFRRHGGCGSRSKMIDDAEALKQNVILINMTF